MQKKGENILDFFFHRKKVLLKVHNFLHILKNQIFEWKLWQKKEVGRFFFFLIQKLGHFWEFL